MDAFTQKRFELMIEMATKKLQQDINSLKDHVNSLNNEIGSLKSQVSRLQFQPQQSRVVQRTLTGASEEIHATQPSMQQKKDVKIVDCRPEDERHEQFQSGAAKNAEPVRPRYGDYEPKDVSIDKFFYFGRKYLFTYFLISYYFISAIYLNKFFLEIIQ